MQLGKEPRMSDLMKRLRAHSQTGTSLEGTMRLAESAADALEAANARIAEFERILDGLPQDAIDGGWTARGISAYAKQLEARVAELNAIINTPHADDFWRAASIEAEHQRQRWGAEGDAGKTPADWFWLVGYLGGKALHAHAAANVEKAEHHVITTAAALANWHRHMFGKTEMRPGIDVDAAIESLTNGESA
jgi:hypothetical protein